MSDILIFDVNETLLDLSPLKPYFARVFGDEKVVKSWFSTMLHSSLVITLADAYKDFSTLAGASLDVVAGEMKITLKEDDRQEILETIKRLPPHEEVSASLERLRSGGFRLFTLTNSPPKTLAGAKWKIRDSTNILKIYFRLTKRENLNPRRKRIE